MKIFDLRLWFYELNGKSFSAVELSDKITEIMLKAIDASYMIPHGIDPIHIFDVMLDLGWVSRDGLVYTIKL